VTIAQYLRLLRHQWIVVTLLATCSLVGAGAYTVLQTPQYQAQAQLFVSSSGQSDDLAQITQGSTFTQQRVKSYVDLITSPRVLDPVIRALGLSTTADRLATKITASSPLDTVLIDLSVTDSSPVRAQDIANAISAQFPALVNQLETPPGQHVSPVKVSITQPAIAPATPVSPRKSLNLALGLLVGLGLGIGVAVLRDSMDRSVGDPLQATEATGTPVLGLVGDDPKVAKTPLITHDAFSPRAEAFKHLRTNIRFLSVDHQLRSLVVTGSVPSEGKTTTAANLAIALAQSGERVVLIDADMRRPAVADLFGLSSGVGLTSVLIGEIEAHGALQTWDQHLPLQVLTAGPVPPNPSELIGSARMVQLIETLTAAGNTVVIDSPPLLPVTDAAVLGRITDGALVVSRVGSTHLEQLSTAVDTLRSAGATVLGLVLNRVPKHGRSGYGGYGAYGGYGTYESYRPQTSGRPEIGAPVASAGVVSLLPPTPQPNYAPPVTPPRLVTPAATEDHRAGTSWIPTPIPLPTRAPRTGVIQLDETINLTDGTAQPANAYADVFPWEAHQPGPQPTQRRPRRTNGYATADPQLRVDPHAAEPARSETPGPWPPSHAPRRRPNRS
jgi:succinoglycan biosynthesis transport protein ExoP